MKKEFNVIIERDSEGYYVASVPELKGCHTQALDGSWSLTGNRRKKYLT